MSNIYLTSDSHFGHGNIIKYCNRPFSSTGEMDEYIIDQINNRVEKDDTLYHLGDFTFSGDHQYLTSLRDRINCENMILIKGNHDKVVAYQQMNIFQEMHDYLMIKVGKQRITLFHYPIESWNGMHHGSWHLFGHIHSMSLGDHHPNKKRLDVGVDAHGYKPWSINEIREFMLTRKEND